MGSEQSSGKYRQNADLHFNDLKAQLRELETEDQGIQEYQLTRNQYVINRTEVEPYGAQIILKQSDKRFSDADSEYFDNSFVDPSEEPMSPVKRFEAIDQEESDDFSMDQVHDGMGTPPEDEIDSFPLLAVNSV